MSGGRGWIMSLMPSPWTANELGALLVAAGLGPPPEHALISLLALNGLRAPEAASHADPRTTMRYDRARGSLDRHAT
jgi:hypothetical protein